MPNWTVVITEPINEAGVELLKANNVEVIHLQPGSKEPDLLRIAPEVDGMITRGSIKVTREIMAFSPRLKVIGVHGIGCDHIDLQAAKELGKVVCNTPDALTITVAEMTIAMMLSMTRRIVSADKAIRAGEWSRKYKDLIGVELAGKTIGLVGLGRIGEATARRLKPFDVRLLYWSRNRKKELEQELGLIWRDFQALLSESDLLSMHIPGTVETHHIIGKQQIASMKQGVMIVNTARGRVIDQHALVEALNSGKISGASLDVFEQEPIDQSSPLLKMDNVILTPHLGASSLEAMRRMATQVAEGVICVLRKEQPANRVV